MGRYYDQWNEVSGPRKIKILPNKKKIKPLQPDWIGWMKDHEGNEFNISLWKTKMKNGEYCLMGMLNSKEDLKVPLKHYKRESKGIRKKKEDEEQYENPLSF